MELRAGSVSSASGGGFHTLALLDDGSAAAFGSNQHDQSTIPSSLSDSVVAVSAGGLHSLALLKDGTVVAWGADGFDQATVPDELASAGVASIAAGGAHNLALVSATG
jgi:alpha-tubulin suppressor-like RCC1 family protein